MYPMTTQSFALALVACLLLWTLHSCTAQEVSLRLNSDFALFPEMQSVQEHVDPWKLFQWVGRRFRNNPVGGLIENKILAHDLLVNWDIPTLELYYGAFATNSMGKYPLYNRAEFLKDIQDIPQVAEQHSFVIKPAIGTSAIGVLIMNPVKWQEDEWTFEKLADYVEKLLDVHKWSQEGQRYEHIGILIQENFLANEEDSNECYSGDFEPDEEGNMPIIELKTHVAFGTICGARLHPVPVNFESVIDISFCNGEPKFTHGSELAGAHEDTWEMVRPVVTQQMERVAEYGEKIATAFGADFYRLDMFIDSSGRMLVNELTYPSLMQLRDDCVYERLVNMYKHKPIDMLNGTLVLESLLKQVNVSYDLFVDFSDYGSMGSWSEEQYDSLYFFYPPAEEDKREELLREQLETNSNDPKTTFHLAELLYQNEEFDEAIELYKKNLDFGGPAEDKYMAHYSIGLAKVDRGDSLDSFAADFLAAHELMPMRAEPLYFLAKGNREEDDHAVCEDYARQALELEPPPGHLMNIDKAIYNWKIVDELSVCLSDDMDKYQESQELLEWLLENGDELNISEEDLERIHENLEILQENIHETNEETW